MMALRKVGLKVGSPTRGTVGRCVVPAFVLLLVAALTPGCADADRKPVPAVSREPLHKGAALDPVARGRLLYVRMTCSSCHSTDGSRLVGPSMRGLWGTRAPLEEGGTALRDADYLRRSILDSGDRRMTERPEGVRMPSYRGRLTEAEVDDLIAFIRSCDG